MKMTTGFFSFGNFITMISRFSSIKSIYICYLFPGVSNLT